MTLLALFKYNKVNANSLAYLLGALETSIVADKIDIELAENILEVLEDRLSQYDKVVVLYSLMTTQLPYYLKEFNILKSLKKKFRDRLLLVAGGPHPTGAPKNTLMKLGFDIAVVGEGEETLKDLLLALSEEYDLSTVSGLAIKTGEKVITTEKRKPIDLSKYPPCSFVYKLYPPIEIMRGCCFSCKYCQTPRIFNYTVRFRPIDYVRKWAKHYVKEGRRTIRFIAPNGFAYGSKDGRSPNPRKLERLLKEIKSIPRARVHLGNFPSEVRPEFVTREVLDVVSKYVVNKTLAIGAQSGSNRVLYIINRQHTVEDVYEAVDLALDYGFTPSVDFMFGLPGETLEDMYQTLTTIHELTKRGAVVRGHTFIPLPGTPFENAPPGKIPKEIKNELIKLKAYGKVTGDWEKQEEIAQRVTKLW